MIARTIADAKKNLTDANETNLLPAEIVNDHYNQQYYCNFLAETSKS